MSVKWYIVIAKQNHDAMVIRNLREQDYEPYSPKHFRKGEKPRRRMSPYIFVPFDAEIGEAGPVKNTRGVERIITDPATSKPVPLRHGDKVVAQLRIIEEEEFSEGTDPMKKQCREDLEIGSRVKVVSGNNKSAIGIEGTLAWLRRGKAAVFAGIAMWEVDDVDLETLEPKKEPKADKAKKGKRRR